MKRWFAFLLLGLFMALPIAVFAQDTDEEAEESAVEMITYEGTQYEIKQPNWKKISGELTDSEKAQLPAVLREQYSPRGSDVIFMRTNEEGQKAEDFRDNINVVVIDEEVPLSEAFANQLKTVLETQYKEMFENFNLVTLGVVQSSGRNVLSLRATYSILNYDITMMQVLVPANKNAFVISCSFDSQRDEIMSPVCREVFESFKIKE